MKRVLPRGSISPGGGAPKGVRALGPHRARACRPSMDGICCHAAGATQRMSARVGGRGMGPEGSHAGPPTGRGGGLGQVSARPSPFDRDGMLALVWRVGVPRVSGVVGVSSHDVLGVAGLGWVIRPDRPRPCTLAAAAPTGPCRRQPFPVIHSVRAMRRADGRAQVRGCRCSMALSEGRPARRCGRFPAAAQRRGRLREQGREWATDVPVASCGDRLPSRIRCRADGPVQLAPPTLAAREDGCVPLPPHTQSVVASKRPSRPVLRHVCVCCQPPDVQGQQQWPAQRPPPPAAQAATPCRPPVPGRVLGGKAKLRARVTGAPRAAGGRNGRSGLRFGG